MIKNNPLTKHPYKLRENKIKNFVNIRSLYDFINIFTKFLCQKEVQILNQYLVVQRERKWLQ